MAEPPPTLSPAPLCRLSLPLFLRTSCCHPPSGGGAYPYPSPSYGCSVREPLCPPCLPSVSVDRAARPGGRASAPSSLAATLAAARPRRVRVPRSGGSLTLPAPAVGPPPGGHARALLAAMSLCSPARCSDIRLDRVPSSRPCPFDSHPYVRTMVRSGRLASRPCCCAP